jgi:tellurite resistance protein TerC
MDLSIFIIVLQLIFLEGILSIDNAAVLGAMVTPLSDHLPIPWPPALKKIGKSLDKVLGNQRVAALRVGLLGAYFGRGIMLVMASFIISNPWLKLVGAAYLIRLAFENLSASAGGGEGDEDSMRRVKETSFWLTVANVELMDLAFSLDNVVAAVSLSDKLWVVMLGVAIGILAMRFAAGLFSYVIEREPILKEAAYILVLNIGIELLLEDLAHVEISDWLRFAISVGTILLALAYAHIKPLQVFRPVLIWVGQGFSNLNELVNWALVPPIAVIKLLIKLVKLPFRKSSKTAV